MTGAAPKIRLATVWLDGCSGCHMSLLDIDERLIALAGRVQVVWGPLVDAKEFPKEVDVTLVEGAVSSEEDLHRIQLIRSRTQTADLAGRLRHHRQRFGPAQPLRRGMPFCGAAISRTARVDARIPRDVIPALLPDGAAGA